MKYKKLRPPFEQIQRSIILVTSIELVVWATIIFSCITKPTVIGVACSHLMAALIAFNVSKFVFVSKTRKMTLDFMDKIEANAQDFIKTNRESVIDLISENHRLKDEIGHLKDQNAQLKYQLNGL